MRRFLTTMLAVLGLLLSATAAQAGVTRSQVSGVIVDGGTWRSWPVSVQGDGGVRPGVYVLEPASHVAAAGLPAGERAARAARTTHRLLGRGGGARILLR